jgi:hypothetical protein
MDTLRIAAVVAAAALAACSGGKGGALTPGLPAPSATVAPSSGSHATLTVVVPHASGSATSKQRMPRYVSPSSAELQVAVNGGAATSFGLSTSSPGCGLQTGNVACTFSIAAPVGNDTLTLTLTDAAGTALSRNVVTAKVAAGTSTPVDVTLAAVPASLSIVPGANAVVDTNVPPYHAAGLLPQPVEVQALDADGNVIIGPGAPTITTVTVTSGAAFASIASTNTHDPGAFLLSPVDGSAGGQTVTISATAQGIALADGTTSQPVTSTTTYLFTPAIVVGFANILQVVSVESGHKVGQFMVCGGACARTHITDLAADAKGNLYGLADTTPNAAIAAVVSQVFVFAPGSTLPSRALGSAQGVHSARGIAVDKQGTLYVANGLTFGFKQPRQNPAVTEYASGASSPTFTIAGTTASPGGIAIDATGNVFVADQSGTGTISKYPPNSQTPSATLADPSVASPFSLAADASGGLYVWDSVNLDIAYFAAGQTAVTSTLTDTAFAVTVNNLMMDPSGNLWVSLIDSAQIREFAASSLPNAISISNTLGLGGAMAWIP